MLRIITNTSAGQAQSYYTAADYYTQGQELVGRWRGEGARRLGLTGNVQQKDWDALCDNRHPATGESLTLRQKQNRRVGWDFNVHCPKSVSLLYATTRDERILNAFRDSVDATMHDIEAEVATRVRKGGRNEIRRTGNLVWGEFIHFTSRPVNSEPDPHLHAHCFAFNSTWDGTEQVFKAADIADVKRDAPYFEAVFHSRLASRLSDLGLPIERTVKGWELAGVSRGLVKKFSRRTQLIEETAREKGIADEKTKDQLGARTRERKQKDLSLPELETVWRARMTPQELDALATLQSKLGGESQPADDTAATRGVDYAIGHLFERRSVVPERELLATALRHCVGAASGEQVERAVDASQLITGEAAGRRMATTWKVLDEEMRVVDFARRGRGACDPFVNRYERFGRDWLNDSQKGAVRHVLQSRDKVIMVRGAAGVGKTTLMQEAVEAIERSGTKVFAFAPSADASRGVLRAAGFKDADTVARLLVDENLQRQVAGQLVWIDEAGLVGMRTMDHVVALAERLNCRLLVSGDKRQHTSVERGSMLQLLEDEAGLVPAEVKEIQRQRGAYKEAVKALSNGRVVEGFNQLDKLGWIREIPDDERYQIMAADYVEAVKARQSALVISPTHAEGNRITAKIRRALRESKKLSTDEREFRTLENASLTEAERGDAVNYLPGDVLQFHQNAKGYQRGQRVAVRDAQHLPLAQAARFQAFHSGTLRIAAGDRLRITHNGLTADGQHRLNNGALYTVKGFTKHGDIILKENGWTVSQDFGHLAHGYCLTSHASQGKTVDRVFVAQSSESFPASSPQQFYVSLSRASKQATVYTQDKVALREAISQSEERMSATELVNHAAQRPVVAMRQQQERISTQREPREREGMSYER